LTATVFAIFAVLLLLAGIVRAHVAQLMRKDGRTSSAATPFGIER
jgi:hypothetical protein